jgi:hypothetical protein
MKGVEKRSPLAGSPKSPPKVEEGKSPLYLASSFRNISKLLATATPEQLAEEEERKAQIAEKFERERQEKLKHDETVEDAKFRAKREQQELVERRSNLRRGVRAGPELRELDGLVLLLQADEGAKRTKYLDWRADILDAVSLISCKSNAVSRAVFDDCAVSRNGRRRST